MCQLFYHRTVLVSLLTYALTFSGLPYFSVLTYRTLGHVQTCGDLILSEQVSDDGLRALTWLTALTDLNLFGCEQVSDIGLQTMGFITSLTSLKLFNC